MKTNGERYEEDRQQVCDKHEFRIIYVNRPGVKANCTNCKLSYTPEYPKVKG